MVLTYLYNSSDYSNPQRIDLKRKRLTAKLFRLIVFYFTLSYTWNNSYVNISAHDM